MTSVNKVILTGNVEHDSEVRYSTDGSAICNVTITNISQWKDKNTGERREEIKRHGKVFYNHLAEITGEYLCKGHPAYVKAASKHAPPGFRSGEPGKYGR